MDKSDIEELIKDEPAAVQKAVRRAIDTLENDKGPDPEDAVLTMVKLGKAAVQGSGVPTAALIAEGIAALITLGRAIRKRRQKRIRRSRSAGTIAGLSAWRASKSAGGKRTRRQKR